MNHSPPLGTAGANTAWPTAQGADLHGQSTLLPNNLARQYSNVTPRGSQRDVVYLG
jgi:hypothetical protein